MLFYYLTVIILNTKDVSVTFQPQLNQLFYVMLSQSVVWVVIFVTPFVCLTPDFAITAYRALFQKSPIDLILASESRKNQGNHVVPRD